MPFIVNYGPQSDWERDTGDIVSWGMAAHSFTSFALRATTVDGERIWP